MRTPDAHDSDPMMGDLKQLDRYWRAANYLSVGQVYLLDNPLLREPLRPEHIKPRLLGHWGTTPGLNFIYAHLNRVIRARDLNVIYICGPGHGGPGMVANTYLEGSYSEIYPDIGCDVERRRRTRLCTGTCLRRRIRQSRLDLHLCGRRRRSRDRPARRIMALQQVSEPGPRRRRATDSAPQWI